MVERYDDRNILRQPSGEHRAAILRQPSGKQVGLERRFGRLPGLFGSEVRYDGKTGEMYIKTQIRTTACGCDALCPPLPVIPH